jgi:hypothetical protein
MALELKAGHDQRPVERLNRLASFVQRVLLQRSHESCKFVMVAQQKVANKFIAD